MAQSAPTDEQLEAYRDSVTKTKKLATFSITKPLFQPPESGNSPGRDSPPRACCMQVDGHVLCDACVQLLDKVGELINDAADTGYGGVYTIALDYLLSDLRVSARLGCHLCSIIEANTMVGMLRGKPSSYKKDVEENSKSWMSIDIRPRGSGDPKQSWVGTLSLVQPGLYATDAIQLEFFPPSSPNFVPPNKASILPGLSHQNTGDQSTFDTIRTWLHTCQTQHDACRNVRAPEPNVPRRLLQLGETQVRVVENTQSFQYACLSHCWGSQEHVPKQLLENGTRQAFDIAILPKTFRDAVSITKTLGLEHLWIDCFCILQGSKEDWLRESAVMAQIYANSVFTVAALTSKNVTEGCFRDRNRLALQPLYTKNLTVRSIYPAHSWRLEVNGYDYQSSPLHTRAWVVQERLSATRTIFYGAMGVYWECRCTRASESFSKPLPTSDQTDSVDENTKLLLTELQSAAEREDRWQVYGSVFFDRWNQLLRTYTQCDLTYASDKLVALSGITRDIERYSGRTYVQGLWAESLAAGLLWRHNRLADTPAEVVSRRYPPSTTTAFPSWSWASFEGTVVHLTSSGPVVWQPVIHPLASAPTHLRLTTWTREVTLVDEDNIALVDDGSKTGDLSEEYLWYGDEAVPEGTRMWALLVQRTETSTLSRAARCLVVTTADTNSGQTGGNERTYRRLGVAVLRFDRPKYDPFPKGEPTEGRDDVVLV